MVHVHHKDKRNDCSSKDACNDCNFNLMGSGIEQAHMQHSRIQYSLGSCSGSEYMSVRMSWTLMYAHDNMMHLATRNWHMYT